MLFSTLSRVRRSQLPVSNTLKITNSHRGKVCQTKITLSYGTDVVGIFDHQSCLACSPSFPPTQICLHGFLELGLQARPSDGSLREDKGGTVVLSVISDLGWGNKAGGALIMDTNNPQGKTTQQLCWDQLIPAGGECNSSTQHRKPTDSKEKRDWAQD